ncbi:MAG: hypothetical protein HKP58_13390, partial [Desulfatitalea sp.]|nr:hypothetical protein [Desulfatitalea sp.]NNK01394.1 hypothetical protein [Desulfatitalea sp.]
MMTRRLPIRIIRVTGRIALQMLPVYSGFGVFCLLATLSLFATATAEGKNAAQDDRALLPAVISDLAIQVNDPYAGGFDWQPLVRALIGTAPGEILTADRMAQAQATLSRFGRVDAHVDTCDTGVCLTVSLRPAHRIKHIDIDGAYPLFEKQVRTAMTIAAGDIFEAVKVAEQKNLIARRYRAEGYIDPRVTLGWTRYKDDGHYQVQVAIDKGPYYVLKKVNVNGNQAFSDDTLRTRMKSFHRVSLGLGFNRFIPARLEEDIRHLTSFYRRKGFADVSIQAETQRDPETGHVVCDLN